MLLLVSQGFGLASLAAYPDFAWIARQVEHAEWTGITCWDLIQPAFTFMVGVAMPFALERRRAQGATFTDLARHVCWRAMVLVLLSNLFSNFGEARLRFELINVLSQIAFGYVICFLVLQVPRGWQVADQLLWRQKRDAEIEGNPQRENDHSGQEPRKQRRQIGRPG